MVNLDSFILTNAYAARLPAGGALAVDREKFANNIPVISVLEGGYDMKGLYNGLNNHLKVLQDYSNE